MGGEVPRGEGRLTPIRVCETCGMGVLLTCLRESLPGPGAAFLIVTAQLRINAVSQPAEALFGPEQRLVGSVLTDVVSDPVGDDGFSRVVVRAALRNGEPEVVPVRRVREAAREAGTLAARVSTCGPPRAALVTVQPSAFVRA